MPRRGAAFMNGAGKVSVPSGTTLQTYNAATGKAAERCTMKAGAKVQDVENGAAVYSVESEVHLLTIATNRDRVVATAKVLSRRDLEPGGLFYAYNVPGGGNEAGPGFVLAGFRSRKPCVRAYSRGMDGCAGISASSRPCLWAARARRRAARPQPDPPPRLRPACRDAELRARRLLPDPPRRREGRDRAAARPAPGASRGRTPPSASARRLVGGASRLPKLRIALSARLCLSFFLLTSVIYLVQADAEGAEIGRWPLLSPWLHSSALPVFAVLSVICAVSGAPSREWLADFEEYAQATVDAPGVSSAAGLFASPGPAFCSGSSAADLRPRVREPSATASCLIRSAP